MVYRHLRQMEEDYLVKSQWETPDAGAAKRIYTITDEGIEVLNLWVQLMQAKAEKLNNFVAMYHKRVAGKS